MSIGTNLGCESLESTEALLITHAIFNIFGIPRSQPLRKKFIIKFQKEINLTVLLE